MKAKFLKHCSIKNILIVLSVLILLYLIYDTYVVRENFADDGFKTQFDTLFGVTQLEDVKDNFDESLGEYCDKIKALNALCTKCDADDLDQPISNPTGYVAGDGANLLSAKTLNIPNSAISCADGYKESAAGTPFVTAPIRITNPTNSLEWDPTNLGNTCEKEYCEIPLEYQTTIRWKPTSGRLKIIDGDLLSHPDNVLECVNNEEIIISSHGIETTCDITTGEFNIPSGQNLCVSRDYNAVPVDPLPNGYSWSITSPDSPEQWREVIPPNASPQSNWESVFKCNDVADINSATLDNTYFGSPVYHGNNVATNNGFEGCNKLDNIFELKNTNSTTKSLSGTVASGIDSINIPPNVKYIIFDLDNLQDTDIQHYVVSDIYIVFSSTQLTIDASTQIDDVGGNILFYVDENNTLINSANNKDIIPFKNNRDGVYYLLKTDDSADTCISIDNGYYYLILNITKDSESIRLHYELPNSPAGTAAATAGTAAATAGGNAGRLRLGKQLRAMRRTVGR